MPLAQWTARRILILWGVAVLLVLAVNVLSGSEAFKSALFFDYIFQLAWLILLMPVIVVTYVWAHAHLDEPTKGRIKTGMVALVFILILLWLRFSYTRFR